MKASNKKKKKIELDGSKVADFGRDIIRLAKKKKFDAYIVAAGCLSVIEFLESQGIKVEMRLHRKKK